MREGKSRSTPEKDFYELALKVSGAVQAARWKRNWPTALDLSTSFNGPHSAVRGHQSARCACWPSRHFNSPCAHERGRPANLLAGALVEHAATTAALQHLLRRRPDAYDVCGRVGMRAFSM